MVSDKRILLIAYYFPPSPAVGGLRLSGFAKYLPEMGWKPYVLTVGNDGLSRGNPPPHESAAIFTAAQHLSLRDAYLRSKSFLASLSTRTKVTPEDLEASYVRPEQSAPSLTYKAKMKTFLVSLVFLPDEKRGWITPATMKAARLIRKERIGAILTSCPPYSSHVVGLILKTLFPRLRWIADFRDPWMTPVSKEIYPKSALSTAIERKLEQSVVGRADLVLTTTEALAEALSAHYQDLSADKFHFLPNGFDPTEFPEASLLEKYDKFTIAYTGSLYFGRTPRPIFEAIRQLLEDGSIASNDIRVKLVGDCKHLNGTPIEDLIGEYGLGSVVEVYGQAPHGEALKIVGKSHLSLLLAPKQPYQIPAKAYEYMGIGTPILALTEEGATQELVNGAGAGGAVHPEDIEGIKAFICRHMRGENRLRPPADSRFRQYERREIVQRFARELDRPEFDGRVRGTS